MIEIHRATQRAAVAGVAPQRLLIKPFRRGVILARHRHIARADKRIAVAVVELARLLVFLPGQREIAGLQRLVAFVDRQPVAGALDQALPLAAVVAVLVGGQRPAEQFQRLRAVAGARIGPPSAPSTSASFGVAANAFCNSGMAARLPPLSTCAGPRTRA